jgi:hypothetical protein
MKPADDAAIREPRLPDAFIVGTTIGLDRTHRAQNLRQILRSGTINQTGNATHSVLLTQNTGGRIRGRH